MKILFNDLGAQWSEIKDTALPKVLSILESGAYIGGDAVEKFEVEFSSYTGRKYSVGVSNGTDGLKLAIQALRCIGKTVVVMSANTYIAAPLSVIQQCQGEYEIALIDIDENHLMDLVLLKEYLSSNRKKYDNCILMPTHLYGHPMNMGAVKQISLEFNSFIIEDASQAHGALIGQEMIGAESDMTVYSMYPGKGLGAAGDAGAITTDNYEYADRLRSIRNYGSTKKYIYDEFGWNHRLDPIQAVILGEKLKHLDSWNQKKIEIAQKYSELLSSVTGISEPKTANYVGRHVYHIYCVLSENREALTNHLSSKGIPTIMHYPVPIQLTEPFKYLNSKFLNPVTVASAKKILSLPIHPFMSQSQVEYISEQIIVFYKK